MLLMSKDEFILSTQISAKQVGVYYFTNLNIQMIGDIHVTNRKYVLYKNISTGNSKIAM